MACQGLQGTVLKRKMKSELEDISGAQPASVFTELDTLFKEHRDIVFKFENTACALIDKFSEHSDGVAHGDRTHWRGMGGHFVPFRFSLEKKGVFMPMGRVFWS